MNEYANYNLIGKLKTNNLTPNAIAIITGFFTAINPIFIISFIIILYFLKKINNQITRLLLITCYFFSNFLLTSTLILKNNLYILAIGIIILLFFLLGLIKYYKTKQKQYLILDIIIAITIISYSLTRISYNHYNEIFLNYIVVF